MRLLCPLHADTTIPEWHGAPVTCCLQAPGMDGGTRASSRQSQLLEAKAAVAAALKDGVPPGELMAAMARLQALVSKVYSGHYSTCCCPMMAPTRA